MLPSQVVRKSARIGVSSQTIASSRAAKKRRLSSSASPSVENAPGHSARDVLVNAHVEEAVVPASAIRRNGRKKHLIEEPSPSDYPRVANEWKFGAHVSVAGGVENAIVNAAEIGANAFALFLKSQRKWSSSDLSDESISLFKSRLKNFDYDPYHVIPHGNYLINLGNPDAEKRQKSFECFLDDLKRCELLGLKLYNFHPGSTVGQASKEECISFIAGCLNKAHKETSSVITVIENMAGAGNVIGSEFAELASIVDQVEDKERVGVCLDTCHAFAAGYDLMTRKGYEETLAEFDSVVGLHYLRAMHLNDSKLTLGSNRDRHENIGLGHLSLSTFTFIARDSRLKNIPLILETPRSSALDPDGESPAVWRTEIEILNQLSKTHDEQTKSPLNGYNEREELVTTWKEMTTIVETVVGRVAVVNGGGANEVTRGKRAKGKRKRAKEVDDKDGHGSDVCD